MIFNDGIECFGLTTHDDLKIEIADDMPAQLEKMILCHEILHVFCLQTGLSVDSDEEEKLVLQLAPLLLQFVQGNPEIISYLQSQCRDSK